MEGLANDGDVGEEVDSLSRLPPSAAPERLGRPHRINAECFSKGSGVMCNRDASMAGVACEKQQAEEKAARSRSNRVSAARSAVPVSLDRNR